MFGSKNFVGDLRDAIQADADIQLQQLQAQADEADEKYEAEIYEDGLGSHVGVEYSHDYLRLNAAPQPTQEAYDPNEQSQKTFDDRKLEIMDSLYSTLNLKTRKIKELKREELELNMEREDAKPFDMLEDKHEEIRAMPDGEDKQASIMIYNTINILFQNARRAPELRFVPRPFFFVCSC